MTDIIQIVVEEQPVEIIVTEQPVQVVASNFIPVGASVSSSYAISSSFANTALTATSASHALSTNNAISALTATSASHAVNANVSIDANTATSASFTQTANIAISASYANVASISDTSISASFATTASYASNVPETSSFAVSSSHSTNANTALTATSASHALNANVAIAASTAISSSHAVNANLSIAANTATSASHATNANVSIAANTATSASNVLYNNIGQKPTLFSGSSQVQLNEVTGTTFANADFVFLGNVNVLGTATVTQLFTQYETSSIIFASGSTKFGDTADDTHQFTGSLSILGTATSVEGFTGSLQGNANTATSSSHAINADVSITANTATSSSFAQQANTAISSSHAGQANTALTATSASHAVNADVSITANTATSSSHAVNADVSITANTATSSSHALNADVAIAASTATSATSSSHAVNADVAIAASTATSSSHAVNADVAIAASTATSSSHALQADTAETANTATSASFAGFATNAGTATSSSHAVQANSAISATSSSHALQANIALTATSASHALAANSAISATSASHAGQSNNTLRVQTADSASIQGIVISTGLSGAPSNIGIGSGALSKLPSSTLNNIAIGNNAFGNMSSSGATITQNNVIIGNNAYASASTVGANVGATSLVAIGGNAMISASSVNSVAIGNLALQRAIGNQQVAIGQQALQVFGASGSVGTLNTAVGAGALQVLIGGTQNTALGGAAGQSLITGSFNTILGIITGLRSGSENTTVGYLSAQGIRTGSQNTTLGSRALSTGAVGSGSYENNIAIGYRAGSRVISASNELFINSLDRTTAAGDYSSSIIYGIQNLTASAQTLRFNAQVIAPFGITGSVQSASYAQTASVLLGSVQSASFATTASAATSITFVPTTASFANVANSALTVISASHALNADVSITANTATSASFATTASFAMNGGGGGITFPFEGDAIITGSLLISGSGAPSQSTLTSSVAATTPIDLNGIFWSGSYGRSSIIPSIASASDLGTQQNPFRNAFFAGFISASNIVGFTGSVAPPEPSLGASSSFTFDASQNTPVTGTSGSTDLHTNLKGCVLNSNGTVNYYLKPTDWTKKIDESAANLLGTDGNVMVEVPKFYVSASQAGSGGSRVVTYFLGDNASLTGSAGYVIHPAFIKGGSEVDHRYVGAYLGSGFDGSNIVTGNGALATGSASNVIRSVSGSAPLTSRGIPNHRTLARNTGTGWNILDYYLWNALQLLFVSEYKTLDSQTAIGVGGGSNTAVAGASTSYGNSSTPSGHSGNVRYRGVESIFGQIIQWLDGILVDESDPIKVYTTNNYAHFNEETVANYVQLSGSLAVNGNGGFTTDYVPLSVTGSSLTLARGTQIIPAVYGGSGTTKFCDFSYTPNSFTGTFGIYTVTTNNNTTQGGLFYQETNSRDRNDAFIGTRLSF